MEPETIANGKRRRLAGEDEMPAWWYVLDAAKLGGSREGEEIDAAEYTGWKIQ